MKKKPVFRGLVIIILIVLYLNFGWVVGYVSANPHGVPALVSFVLNPFGFTSTLGYNQFMQVSFCLSGGIFWILEWIAFVIIKAVVIMFGGLAKLFLIP